MALLNRDDWYDISRDVDWEPTYVDAGEAFPEGWQGLGKVPKHAFGEWDEPFRVCYRDYVRTQREKDTGVYAVKDAFKRANIFDVLDEGHKAAAHLHMGSTCGVEQTAVTMQSRFARFAPSPRWRTLGVFGMLDEIRHAQLDLAFAHDLVRKDPRFDWTQKAFHTNEWGVIAVRHFFDGFMQGGNCVDATITQNLTVEHGFTNMQFIAFAADAMEAGDVSFANILSSIQTDEARHAQQGFPTLEVLVQHDRERAQTLLDMSFWRALRLFHVLTGPAMDYYTPLKRRKMSFKEFMLEWIVNHHERTLQDYGLDKPWYWDQFLLSLEHGHHALHIGTWFWRPTLWWKPNAGISRAERKWLNEKYPSWDDSWGYLWDVIGENAAKGDIQQTLPLTLPALCNICQLPLGSALDRHHLKPEMETYNGRLYHFCSEPCHWIFNQDVERYAGHMNVVDRFIAGQIQPMSLEGGLQWMGLTPDVMGDDAYGYSWAEDYKQTSAA